MHSSVVSTPVYFWYNWYCCKEY